MKKDEKMSSENIQEASADIQKLGDRDLDSVSGGGCYEDHFVYDETTSHSKRTKGLLDITTLNGGSKQ